jgi:hypothetical protein
MPEETEYIVTRFEVHRVTYVVMAENDNEAVDKVGWDGYEDKVQDILIRQAEYPWCHQGSPEWKVRVQYVDQNNKVRNRVVTVACLTEDEAEEIAYDHVYERWDGKYINRIHTPKLKYVDTL